MQYSIFLMSLLMILGTSLYTITTQAETQHVGNDAVPSRFISLMNRGLGCGLLALAIGTLAHSLSPYQNSRPTSCLPEKEGPISLGQHNFTHGLEQNPFGHYILTSPINFSNFSAIEQMKYPLYNLSFPFQGELDMASHYMSDFHLYKTGVAALFGAISNSTLHVTFKNSSVIGTHHTAILAAVASGRNTINMTVDHANAKTINTAPLERSLKSTGIVFGNGKQGNFTITLTASTTKTSTEALLSALGIIAGSISDSTLDAKVNIGTAQLIALGNETSAGTYVGTVGYATQRRHPGPLKIQAHFENFSVTTNGQHFSATAAGLGNVFFNAFEKHTSSVITIKAGLLTMNTSANYVNVGAALGTSTRFQNEVNVNVQNFTIITSGLGKVGSSVGRSICSQNDIKATIGSFTSLHTGSQTCAGGIIGYVQSDLTCPLSTPLSMTAFFDNMTMHNLGPQSATGGLIGCSALEKGKINAQLNHGHIKIFTNNTPSALILGYLSGISNRGYALINDVTVTIDGQPNALGIGNTDHQIGRNNLDILLITGKIHLPPASSFLLQPYASPYSLVDQSGVDVNTNTIASTNTTLVQSIEPRDWRIAMARVQPALCSLTQLSCHYPNEKRISLTASPEMMYLISQQTYPYNHTAETMALTRVTGLLPLHHQTIPMVDVNFGTNGIALYKSHDGTHLPPTSPHSIHVDGQHLFHLYKKNDASVLAFFDLNQKDGAYRTNRLNRTEAIVQLDQGGIWLQRNQTLLEHYIIEPISLTLTHKDHTIQLTKEENSSATSIIGASFFNGGIYVARFINEHDATPIKKHSILFEHYVTENTPMIWNATLQGDFSDINRYTMHVNTDNSHNVVIALLPSTKILTRHSTKPIVHSVNIEPQGGPAQWHDELPTIFVVHYADLDHATIPFETSSVDWIPTTPTPWPIIPTPNNQKKLLLLGPIMVIAVGLTAMTIAVCIPYTYSYHKTRKRRAGYSTFNILLH